MESACSGEQLIESLDRANARACAAQLEFLQLVALMDRLEIWRDCDAADMAQWLYIRYGVSDWKARKWIAAAHALGDLPRVSAAFERGDLGIDKVVELTRFATAETEAGLIPWARNVAAGRIRKRAELALKQTVDEVATVDENRSVAWWYFDDGRQFALEAVLPSAQGAVVAKAIGRLADALPVMPGEAHPHFTEQRRADALVALASAQIAGDPDPDRATVVIHTHLDADGVPVGGSEVESGPPVPRQTVERLLCGARVQALIENSAGDVVGLGRMSREPSEWMIRQLRHRDRGCTFPGCGAVRWTQAHHIAWWSRGGRTDLENLVLTCLFHHKLVHEYGWSIRRTLGGEVHWLRPDGVRFHARPAPPGRAA